MARVLVIDSSPDTTRSASRALTRRFVSTWSQAFPYDSFVYRDIGRTPPPHLDEATIGAFFTAPEKRTDEQQSLVRLSDEFVEELESADVIVLGVPMHNFSVPSGFKAWIDHAARAGRTFRYTENGPEGLLGGRKVFVLTARGGDYSEGRPAHAMDHQAPYLRTMLGFLGLEDVSFVHAQGTASGDAGRAQAEMDLAATVSALKSDAQEHTQSAARAGRAAA